jgi:hypothetical protein
MDADHRFRLVPVEPGRTRFEQDETLRGLLIPVGGSIVAQIRQGCEAMADAPSRGTPTGPLCRQGDRAGATGPGRCRVQLPGPPDRRSRQHRAFTARSGIRLAALGRGRSVALTIRLVLDAIDGHPAGAVSSSEIQAIITDGVDAFLRAYR